MAMTDLERRRELQRHTLVGLEEDLDDLRDDLADALDDYEGRLRIVSGELPSWLALDPAQVRAQFDYDDEICGRGRLGPRAVAMGAARVEAFIHTWIGQAQELADVEDVVAFDAACDKVRVWLKRLEDLTRELALDADSTLGEWLDEILADLEDKRESDAMALSELVGTGDVGKGTDAREEIAALFEEQRVRAAELREVWGEVEALVFEGVDITVAGVAELDRMLDRALEGLTGALAPKSEPEGMEIDEASDTVLEIDEIPDTQMDFDEGMDRPGLHVDEPRQTEPIDATSSTSPFLRRPRVNRSDDPDSGDREVVDESDDLEAQESLVNDESTAEREELAEVQTSDNSQDDIEVEDVSEVRQDDSRDGGTDEVSKLGAESSSDSSVDEDSLVEGAEAAKTSEDTEAEPREDLDFDSGEAEEIDSREHTDEIAYTGGARRVVAGWRPVSGKEKALIVGLPLLVVLLITPPALIKIMGRDPVVDPFDALPWLYPWGFAIICAWVFIGMVMRQWRPIFNGPRMQLVQWSEHPEDAEVRVSDDALRLGALRLRWNKIKGDVTRWESKADGTFGWMIDIRPRGSTSICMMAPERNFILWEQSELPIRDVPDDAWQITPVVMQKLRDRL